MMALEVWISSGTPTKPKTQLKGPKAPSAEQNLRADVGKTSPPQDVAGWIRPKQRCVTNFASIRLLFASFSSRQRWLREATAERETIPRLSLTMRSRRWSWISGKWVDEEEIGRSGSGGQNTTGRAGLLAQNRAISGSALTTISLETSIVVHYDDGPGLNACGVAFKIKPSGTISKWQVDLVAM